MFSGTVTILDLMPFLPITGNNSVKDRILTTHSLNLKTNSSPTPKPNLTPPTIQLDAPILPLSAITLTHQQHHQPLETPLPTSYAMMVN